MGTPRLRFSPILCTLAFAAQLAAQDPGAARVDRAAVLRHYAQVEAELRAAPVPTDPTLAARRAQVIDHLRDYREQGVFGVDRSGSGARVPQFVDDAGRRCAVAWLLDRTGQGEMVLSIQRRWNDAWIADLASEPALKTWLSAHGLTLAEAARIQMPGMPPPSPEPPMPEPEPRDPPTWTPPTGTPSTPGAGGGTTPPSARPSTGRPEAPTARPTTGRPATPAARGGSPRGIPVDSLESASWLDWWQWNRGAFEQQGARLVPAAPATTTAADPDRGEAVAVLEELAASTHAPLRAAAVAALGRVGVGVDRLQPHLSDAAREVRLMALLGLGSAGTAAHAHVLAAQATPDRQGEAIAVALAGIALLDDGPARRMLAATVDTLLGDQRTSVHTAAALASVEHDAAAALASAKRVLATASTPLQRAAAAQLLGGAVSDENVALLTDLANDRSVEMRRASALALGRTRHALALPAMMSAYELEHEATTRSLLLLAIGDHGGDAARAFLLRELGGGSKALRAHAALALGLWGRGRDGVDDLATAITGAFGDERNRDQKGAYLLALGMLRHAASRALMQTEAVQGANSSTRGAAVAALGLLGDRTALPEVTKTLVNDSCPWVRQQAARALASLGREAVPALVAALRGDKDGAVQREAALALGAIGDAPAFAALVAAARDEQLPAVARAGAASGLGRQFRVRDPQLAALRFQRDNRALPAITAWAFAQEL